MKLIGITAKFDEKTNLSGISDNYVKAVRRAGGAALLMPIISTKEEAEALINAIDGLILSGGGDVNPARYGEETLPCCGTIDFNRDQSELLLLDAALRRNIPVLGICRGVQVLNVGLGGTLYQDIATQRENSLFHPAYDDAYEVKHTVSIASGTKLMDAIGQSEIGVNTCHHQAIKEPGKGMIVSARSADGLIEGVETDDGRYILGIQWHPECLQEKHDEALAIFKAFIAHC